MFSKFALFRLPLVSEPRLYSFDTTTPFCTCTQCRSCGISWSYVSVFCVWIVWGWGEGSRIGAVTVVSVVGLDLPLLAVIKTMKLGLGMLEI
jgi:hypothetical protein